MSKQSKSTTPPKSFKIKGVIIGIVAFAIIGVVMSKFALPSSANETTTTKNHPVGPTDQCKAMPRFVSNHGLQQPVMIDFTQKDFVGFRIVEARGQQRSLALPQWSSKGNLGPYCLDARGNIYTTGVPYVSLEKNKPEEQNKIYIVDQQTGGMSDFINLPWAKAPSANNPYGAIGLAYDCKTKSLYAASLAGSTAQEEVGQIMQVDVKTKKVISTLPNVDALSVGVFDTKSGKRLYYGSARTPEVFSILLDKNGNFVGQPQFEFSLAAQKGGSSDKAHRIRFFKDNRMEIKAIEFSYSLMAASDPMRNIYNFKYNPTTDSWDFLEVYKQ